MTKKPLRNENEVWRRVDERREAYAALSDRIWGMPEICYTEKRSAAEHRAMLAREGFRITDALGGIPTALLGEAGSGGPVIAILGEYDALPGLSQKAGVAEPSPIESGGHGHGCGHNMLGSAALLAASAVKDELARTGLPGRVRYYGCPAEEGGAAKTFLVRDGCFDDVDIAISWHPSAFSYVHREPSLANTRMDFRFTGRAAHAAAAPHLGRSALDAVELMNVGVNYMREHMPSDARVHYAIIDAGGVAPNVVQARATVRYSIRARELADMRALVARVQKVAEGAALMTETRVECELISAVSNLVPNLPLERAMQAEAERLGGPAFDDSDAMLGRAIQATLSEDDRDAAFRAVGVARDARVFAADILPLEGRTPEIMVGSTDLGDVSWAVPTVQFNGACYAVGTPGHSWQLVAQGKAPAAHKALVNAAKVMAATAMASLTDSGLRERAKSDHRARLTRQPYVCPLPADTKPPIGRMG